VVFVLNGLIFFLIGLQLPAIVRQLGDISLTRAIGYGLTISFILILTRLFCTLAASPFTWLMSHFIKVADPRLQWRTPLIFGWAGMRGVVSLAAALSIPLYIAEKQSFPFRNLILFITFIVILVTLVFQGLTLPWLIRKVKPEDKPVSLSTYDQETIIQREIAQHSIQFLEEKYGEDLSQNEHAKNLYSRLKNELNFLSPESGEIKDTRESSLKNYEKVYFEMLEQQRKLLNEMNSRPEFNEELIRKYLSLIDLEELKLREKVL